MKIAFFLSTSGHSGVDRSMSLLIPELLRRGYKVDLVKIRKHGPYLTSHMPNFQCIELPTKHTMTAVFSLVRYLSRERPDILFADKDRANRVALLANRFAGSLASVVVSSGTIMSINLKNRSIIERIFHKISLNYLYKYAKSIVVPSIEAANDLAEISNIKRDDISVVPLPVVDPDVISKSLKPVDHPWFSESESIPVLTSVGELCKRKDQTTLLKAFYKVRKKIPCRLLILGKGKDLAQLIELSKELRISNDIDFLGFQANPFAYIARSNLFVHTAKFEGFGMAIVEAMFLGVNVVATACPGGPGEILDFGRLGKLVPVADSEALSLEILASVCQKLQSKEALRYAVEPYTVKKSADAYLSAMGLPNVSPTVYEV